MGWKSLDMVGLTLDKEDNVEICRLQLLVEVKTKRDVCLLRKLIVFTDVYT